MRTIDCSIAIVVFKFLESVWELLIVITRVAHYPLEKYVKAIIGLLYSALFVGNLWIFIVISMVFCVTLI